MQIQMRTLPAVALCLLSVSAVRAQVVQVDAASLFEYDRDLPLLQKEEPVEDKGTYTQQKVSFLSINNHRVPAVLAMPKDKKEEKVPCVIVMHGLGGNKNQMAALFGLSLLKAGFAAIAIDAELHGDRSPEWKPQLFGKNAYTTRNMLAQTIVDVRRTVDYLQQRPDIDPDRISYLGFSMGSILGSTACGVDKRIKAPVLCLGGGGWKTLLDSSSLPPLKEALKADPDTVKRLLGAMDSVDPVHFVSGIAPRPVLFIHGDADKVVPPESAKLLHNAAGDPKEVMWYKGDHVPAGLELPKVLARITTWLTEHLKPKGADN